MTQAFDLIPGDLVRMSSLLGKEPSLVQGAGGNTSFKDGNVLWIKASGTWLSQAETGNIFVPLDYVEVTRRIASDDPEPVKGTVLSEEVAGGLRPSVETTLHALLPHRYVAHVHSVNTLAWAVMEGGRHHLESLLNGLHSTWVDYVRPGLPLTRTVRASLDEAPVDILVMANHGLVVGGETVEQVFARLNDVEERLHRPVRKAPPPDIQRLEDLAAGTAYRLPQHEAAHSLGTDEDMISQVSHGTLYPDHLVFLGSGVHVLNEERIPDVGAESPMMLIVPGAGVLVHERISQGGEEMVHCLAMVGQRLSPVDTLRYLTDEEEAELLGWDAEKYRKQLNQA